MHNVLNFILLPIYLFSVDSPCKENALDAGIRPAVSNMQAITNAAGHRLVITYDISSKDKSPLSISVELINSKGLPLHSTGITFKGDLGALVRPGNHKTIYCDYPDTIEQIGNYQVCIRADDRATFDLQEILSKVDTARIRKRMESIAGIRNDLNIKGKETAKKEIAGSFIHDKMEVMRQPFVYDGMKEKVDGENLIGRIKAQGTDPKRYLLCAHYDTYQNCGGADDNASGIAAMLEVAEILSGYALEHTVDFAAWDLEEYGLVGSTKYLEAKTQQQKNEIGGVINMDMVGYYSDVPNSQVFPEELKGVFPEQYKAISTDRFRGNFAVSIATEHSTPLSRLYDSCASAYVPGLKVISLLIPGNGSDAPDLRRGDHAVFWDAGIMALYLGDGADTRNTHYHAALDQMADMNLTHIGNVTKVVLASLAKLAVIHHTTASLCTISDLARR
ncbi:MAG TPA: M28 family peptidase [Puia sp.]|nr:M28 family peptidase [Puia sp.]